MGAFDGLEPALRAQLGLSMAWRAVCILHASQLLTKSVVLNVQETLDLPFRLAALP